MKNAWLLICAMSLLLIASESLAHQQKTALTRVLFNPATGNIEFMHRFYLHDADHAAGVLFNSKESIETSAQAMELFANYVQNRFAVGVTSSANAAADSDGTDEKELPLTYIGSEVDGQFLWVYQESSDPGDLSAMSVIDVILRDIWPEQSNLVNIEKSDQIYSMIFDADKEMLTVGFE